MRQHAHKGKSRAVVKISFSIFFQNLSFELEVQIRHGAERCRQDQQ